MANMWGSWAKQAFSAFLKDSQEIILQPNQTLTYTEFSVVELPEVDGPCVLLSRAEADGDYQPLAENLTELVEIPQSGLVGKSADGAVVHYNITGYENRGITTSLYDNDGTVYVSIDFDNAVADAADDDDVIMFGKVAAGFVTVTKKITIGDLAALIGPGAFGYATTWDNDSAIFAFEHNLNSLDVMVQLYDIDTNDTIMINQINRLNANQVHLEASEAPTGSGWRVLVQKIA